MALYAYPRKCLATTTTGPAMTGPIAVLLTGSDPGLEIAMVLAVVLVGAGIVLVARRRVPPVGSMFSGARAGDVVTSSRRRDTRW
jgi:hypothetical protein